ncbi:hypothetical protein HY641_02330 [Candidatus Woesearchaeota archaeon]|nr:hypothetical protein [Candidatus Woesearchaeota archaeon]
MKYISIGPAITYANKETDITLGRNKVYGKGLWRVVSGVDGDCLETEDTRFDNTDDLVYVVNHQSKECSTTYQVNFSKDLYFCTSNDGKMASAQRSLASIVELCQVPLDTSEKDHRVEDVASHKALVAHAVLGGRPVLCDDSGFAIPDFAGWPGNRVARILRDPHMGLGYFRGLARGTPRASYWLMTLAYMDLTLDAPRLFTSKVWGTLIDDARGPAVLPSEAKSELWRSFCLSGRDKTLIEMTPEELKSQETDRWPAFREYLASRPRLAQHI